MIINQPSVASLIYSLDQYATQYEVPLLVYVSSFCLCTEYSLDHQDLSFYIRLLSSIQARNDLHYVISLSLDVSSSESSNNIIDLNTQSKDLSKEYCQYKSIFLLVFANWFLYFEAETAAAAHIQALNQHLQSPYKSLIYYLSQASMSALVNLNINPYKPSFNPYQPSFTFMILILNFTNLSFILIGLNVNQTFMCPPPSKNMLRWE